MNFFNDDEKLKSTFGIKRGQLPKTRFIDNIDAVKVKLLNWPDEERIKRHLIQFATGSWFEDFSEIANEDDYRSALEELSQGKILAQGLEGVQFSFLVSGLSLHGSHAIVRTRIGAAYLQQSQAVCDLRHSDILVPRAYQKHIHLLKNYQNIAIAGKHLYAEMLETDDIAVTDARFSLLKTIPVWVNISMSLPTILGVYSKRTDVTEEHPEMNRFAELLRLEIEKIFPWMSTYFKRDANCIHRFEGYRSNCVFKRDGNDVLQPGAKENWHFHDKTKSQLMLEGLEPFKIEYFISYNQVTKEEYDRYK
ncbi:MAG: FAD-dependent thymidylate synthase [Flavobacteriales bacterium]|nr:FAD-dependent thymidylate synthase [Flavobacteriales bacterium]